MAKKLNLKFCGKTDVGAVRKNNEDAFALLPEENFYIVADGMGGHRAGEVASQKAVDFMCGAIKTLLHVEEDSLVLEELSGKVQLFIESANYWVNHLGKQDPQLQGMGTTLCSLLFHEEKNETETKTHVICSNVGDSRIYRLRDQVLYPMTEDHSATAEFLEIKSTKKSSNHISCMQKKVLTRVIGASRQVFPDVSCDVVKPGDVYLLCSDGLTDLLNDSEILAIVQQKNTLIERLDSLLRIVQERGAHDNVTLVLIEVAE